MSQNHVQPVLETCQQSWQLKIYDVSITQYAETTSWLFDYHDTLHETLFWLDIYVIMVMCMAKVHLPPMNKFVCKLHGYIVYFILNSGCGKYQ